MKTEGKVSTIIYRNEKNGYTVYGEIKDCPPGTIKYFLKKNVRKSNIECMNYK